VPLQIGPGDEAGVLAAEVSWAWVERLLGRMEDAFTAHRPLELLLASRDGTLLAGPPRWLGRKLDGGVDLSENGNQVLGRRTQLRLADSLGFGWTAVVRQPTDVALQAVRSTRHMVFLIVFLAGLLSAAGAMAVTRVLTRRLSLLAVDAEAVRRGERRSLAAPPGADEVSRIGATLAVVVDHLQAEKQSLQVLNAELDQRVAERTARIERMADEARHAAVTRERLRIARDLHDTLAHSLMALLTQIRLVRKLHRRMDATELEDELGRAEAVASTGLADARAAIGQMRDNGVRDTGLTPALHDLARRFRQRSGVELTLVSEGPAQDWADERAETVFRIVEEALRNVERHAQAQAVGATLHWSISAGGAAAGEVSTRVCIEVVDDGVGFDLEQPQSGHYGLRGMQEQAALIDARLEVASRPGQGTRVLLDCRI
jgi:signal transduction histidine kinase